MARALGIVSRRRIVSHTVDGLPVSTDGKFPEFAHHQRNLPDAAFLGCCRFCLCAARRNYFTGVVATGPGKVELPWVELSGVALPAAAAAGYRSRAPASEYLRTRPGITPR